ncbi:MAG TPA: T9SS type A sorting domain-containing protein, partial [Ignavibacteriaceae bacterium]|nr:T9SS type A sorting domain-containing protein [Ignavibacteriaceae bacterium]
KNPLSLGINSNDYIFAGTAGGGVFRSINPTVGVDEKDFASLGYSLEQNYPNPFNPATNFGFRIAKSGFVSLKVYDILGKEVAAIVEKELAPGEYHFQFSFSNSHCLDGRQALTSGVYFYRLKAGDFISTKKFILLK